MRERTVLRMPAFRSAGFAAVLALVALANPVLAMPATGSDTVKGLYDTLLNTMKNGHILGQSGRFVQLEPTTVGGLQPKDKVKELVMYAISEPYFELRQQLGLAIG